MLPPLFSDFLQQAYDDCMQTDAGLLLYEVYILFLFTQILREIMGHLAIQENSDYHDILGVKQWHIIIAIRRHAAPLSLNFKYNKPLPHSDSWAEVSTPSRTRAWITWPDVINEEAKQYSGNGKSNFRDIPQNFEENDFLGGQTKAPANHPLWTTEYAKEQGRPLRRRPGVRSFPFSPTSHPFTVGQADLLFFSPNHT